jgi:hypothetical protein
LKGNLWKWFIINFLHLFFHCLNVTILRRSIYEVFT